MGRITTAIAALAAAIALAVPASAQPASTGAEQDFIDSVASQGYAGNVLEAGYSVCQMLDDGMSHEGINRFLADTFNDRREHASYYASIFAQYATYNLCPRNLDEYGPI
jgi:hypothetical protein